MCTELIERDGEEHMYVDALHVSKNNINSSHGQHGLISHTENVTSCLPLFQGRPLTRHDDQMMQSERTAAPTPTPVAWPARADANVSCHLLPRGWVGAGHLVAGTSRRLGEFKFGVSCRPDTFSQCSDTHTRPGRPPFLGASK
jgi:hypothetical protein